MFSDLFRADKKQEILPAFKCSLCKLDIRVKAKDGGCKCYNLHSTPINVGSKVFESMNSDYEYFDYEKYLNFYE